MSCLKSLTAVLLPVFSALAILCGCASTGGAISDSVTAYRPAVDVSALKLPGDQETEVVAAVEESGENKLPVVPAGRTRPLRHGDRLIINLHVLDSTTLQEQVDESGNISLPYIGSVRVVGMTTAQAESEIRRIYVEVKRIYKTLEVSVRAEAEEFFVRGQVQRPGRYTSLTGDKTLLQAIAEAGGFTPFANRKKVRVIRAGTGDSEFYNAERIERGEDTDPLIEPSDQIVVPRKLV